VSTITAPYKPPGFAKQILATTRTFQELSKSGIVALVLISVLGGYFIGQPGELPFEPFRLIATLFGVMFMAAGSSALNQLQEISIDREMPRTASRPLPSGRMSVSFVATFVGLTILVGLVILAWISRPLFFLGLAAIVSYNGLYTLWWKKKWAHAAIPGAIPGALPILMGYAAASRQVWSPGGLYLFFILFFWQMPHFWVLALRYKEDYRLGGIPTLPVAQGSGPTTQQIVIWCLAYVGLALGAPLFLPVGNIYVSVAIITGIKVIYELIRWKKGPESKNWLRFFLWVNFSLIAYLAAAVVDLWCVYVMPYWVAR
jgi:protoheme IX farnesyltransferase